MQKVLQPLYFAREDTKRPFYYALAAMVINAVLAIALAPLIGFLAAAVGTTLAGWGMLALLCVNRTGMGDAAQFDARLTDRLWRILGAALIMGIALWGMQIALPLGGDTGSFLRLLSVLLLCIAGAAVYGGAGLLLKAFTLGELRSAFRR